MALALAPLFTREQVVSSIRGPSTHVAGCAIPEKVQLYVTVKLFATKFSPPLDEVISKPNWG